MLSFKSFLSLLETNFLQVTNFLHKIFNFFIDNKILKNILLARPPLVRETSISKLSLQGVNFSLKILILLKKLAKLLLVFDQNGIPLSDDNFKAIRSLNVLQPQFLVLFLLQTHFYSQLVVVKFDGLNAVKEFLTILAQVQIVVDEAGCIFEDGNQLRQMGTSDACEFLNDDGLLRQLFQEPVYISKMLLGIISADIQLCQGSMLLLSIIIWFTVYFSSWISS